MLSLVHMSGDPSLIRGALKPAGLFLNEVQGLMSEDDKAAVRALALRVIADYRDRGCPEPEPIGGDLLKEVMQGLGLGAGARGYVAGSPQGEGHHRPRPPAAPPPAGGGPSPRGHRPAGGG